MPKKFRAPQTRAFPRALAFAGLLAVAACVGASPRALAIGPLEGAWHQLGVPVRLGSPLLWDDAGQRLVVIGADMFGVNDSIGDAWEFREGTGWKRLVLPQSPIAPGLMGQAQILADPGHRRFVALVSELHPYAASTTWLWALELAPEPRWRALDPSPDMPSGILLLDVRGESAWLLAARNDSTLGLWTRSLSDTGSWHLSRLVPDIANAFTWTSNQWVDSKSGQLYALTSTCTGGAPDCFANVGRIPLQGTEGWSFVAEAPLLAWKTVPDTARHRTLVFERPLGSGGAPVWSFDPDAAEPFRKLAEVDAGVSLGSFALAPAEVWVQGVEHGASNLATLAVSLADPGVVREAWAPAWPRFTYAQTGSPFFRDAAENRWLYLPIDDDGSRFAWSDTLWDLELRGGQVSWTARRIFYATLPPEQRLDAWVNDEARRRLLVMTRWDDGTHPASSPLAIYELLYDGEPRWNYLAGGRPEPFVSPQPAVVLDPSARQLVYLPPASSVPGTSQAWTLDVDSPASGWTAHDVEGEPPTQPDPPSLVYDPLHERILFTSSDPALGSLELRPRMRWVRSGLPVCPFSPLDCVPHQRGARGILDPLGSRALLFGGEHSWLLQWMASLTAVTLGDTLGPVNLLSYYGPGGQRAALAGYDESRDALIVFGTGDAPAAPSLYEVAFDRSGVESARVEVATAHADRIEVRWTSTSGASFLLWRHDPANGWRALEPLAASTSGALSFEDRAIDAGLNYGYRLTSPDAPYAPAAAPVWVTAGVTASSLTLAPPWPNPSDGELNVAFTLAASAPADLDVFDLAGRRVWSRRWEAPSAGPHHVALTAGELPRSGLFFVRLRQAGRSATTRIVVTR